MGMPPAGVGDAIVHRLDIRRPLHREHPLPRRVRRSPGSSSPPGARPPRPRRQPHGPRRRPPRRRRPRLVPRARAGGARVLGDAAALLAGRPVRPLRSAAPARSSFAPGSERTRRRPHSRAARHRPRSASSTRPTARRSPSSRASSACQVWTAASTTSREASHQVGARLAQAATDGELAGLDVQDRETRQDHQVSAQGRVGPVLGRADVEQPVVRGPLPVRRVGRAHLGRPAGGAT